SARRAWRARARGERRGAEPVGGAAAGGVAVRRAGLEQAVARAAFGEQRHAGLRMGRIEDLDAVDALRLEAIERGEHLLRVGDVPERVRPHRDAAGVVDRGDRRLHGRRGTGDEGRRAGYEVALEEALRAVAHAGRAVRAT